ncbi:hypothetical protein [Pelagibacterium sp.]|uniref:hypothetical protein n=1 Tax=Pelagibacterium sp. TaxID=1967288 RepID=UPI003A91C21A
MDQNVTALERAFQLAESGRFTGTADIKRALLQEGYSVQQITGRVLMRQLRTIILERQKAHTR